MRLGRSVVLLAVTLFLSSTATPEAFAGKRRPSSHMTRPPGGYAIPQIRGGVTAKGSTALRGFEHVRQIKASQNRRIAGGPNRGIDSDALIRSASSGDDPILMEFGLPYIAGVPTVAMLLPPPPKDEFSAIFGPGLLGFRPGM